MHSKRKRRTVLVALLAFVLATSAYAFTNTNTFGPGGGGAAGDGNSGISGFVVSNVSYDLDDTDPSLLDSVSFTLTPAANGEVKAKTDNSTWMDCTTGASVTCDFPVGTTVVAATNLRVVAAS